MKVENLSYKYPNQSSIDFPDLSLEKGESCLVLGGSGVGKTTFLHLVAGLMKPTTGRIEIGGKDITQLSGRSLDTFRGKKIGIVFQKNHFVAALPVIDNLVLSQSLAGKVADKNYCQQLLDRLNIGHYSKKLTSNLSEGEKQRVSIARALVNRPQLVLADEPTSALDDDNCQSVIKLLKDQVSEINASLIIVTHDNRLKDLVDKRVVLHKNQINA